MKIAYLSLTGNVRKFVKEVGIDSIELDYSNPLTEVHDKYILIVPTYDEEITELISDFIDHKDNLEYLVGLAGSGNRNFNKSYCSNAKDLSIKYNKPLIMNFEFSGTNKDIEEFKKEVLSIEVSRA